MKLLWKKDGRGRQVSICGRYAVQSDGYSEAVPSFAGDSRNARERYDNHGVRGREWAAILVERDENLDWFDTMYEAKAHCEAHSEKEIG